MKIILFILLLIGPFFPANAQSSTSQLDSTSFNDGSFRTGVLDNGLAYYIKSTHHTEAKFKMNFIVKVGFQHEEPHEYNFAHHIEHLAFRPSENFSSGITGNSKLLNKLGMASKDLMGRTNSLETDYYFNPPGKNSLAIKTGLLWFKDIASGLDLTAKNINRERGVLLQEYTRDAGKITDLAAKNLLFSHLFPCLADGTRKNEHIMQFPYHDLQKFHKKWYRPDLMGVSIVGKIDNIDQLEEKVRRTFSEIEPIFETMPIVDCIDAFPDDNPNNLSVQPQFALVHTTFDSHNDRNGKRITYHLNFRDRSVSEKSGGFELFRNHQTASLIGNILNKRLKESLKEYGITFDFYGSYKSGIFPNSLHVIVGSDLEDEKRALTKAMTIVNQLRRHGITTEEVEQLKNEELARIHSTDTSGTLYWQKEIRNHFIYDNWLSSSKLSKEKDWIKQLSVQEVNDHLQKMVYGPPEVIGVISPKNYTKSLISENNIRKFIQQIFDRDTERYDPDVSELILMDKKELDALPVKPVIDLKNDVEETLKIQLANGLKVILKPNNAGHEKTNRIFLHGFTPIGASSFPDTDYYSAMFSPFIVRHSGIGRLDKFSLDELIKVKKIHSLTMPYLHLNESGIKARGSSDELETLLQLIYLYFTQARKDKSAFEDWQQAQERFTLQNAARDRFDELNAVTGDFIELPRSSKRVKASKTVEFEKSHLIYNRIFGQAQEFTFILTGDFFYEKAIPLLQKYLGNLPNNSFIPQDKSASMKLPPEPGYHEFSIPDSYNSDNYSYGAIFIRDKVKRGNWKEEFKIKALENILAQLIWNLRMNKDHSIFSANAAGKYNAALRRFEISLFVTCVPEDFGPIRKEIHKDLEDLKKGKISSDVITNGLNIMKKKYNEAYFENHLNVNEELYRFYRFGEPMVANKTKLEFIEALTPEDIIQTANEYLQEEAFYEVLMK